MSSHQQSMDRAQLWKQLQLHGLAEGDLPPVHAGTSSWHIRLMQSIAGWIGAMFLLGFVGMGLAFVIDSAVAALVVGAIGCLAAYAIFRVARDNDFATQFGLAISLAAQAVFVFGLFKQFEFGTSALYVLVLVFEVTLVLLVSNFIHRVLTTVIASLALWYLLNSLGLYGIASGLLTGGLAWVWLDERRWAGNGALWRPIGYGTLLALLQLESMRLFGWGMRLWSSTKANDWWMHYGWWIGTALTTAVLLWSAIRMLAQQDIAANSKAGLAAVGAVLLLSVLSLKAPGIATAVLMLLLGFTTGNRILMGVGLMALLAFVSRYYYYMQTTLLVKSAVLAVSGGLLLSARLVLHRVFPMATETEASHA